MSNVVMSRTESLKSVGPTSLPSSVIAIHPEFEDTWVGSYATTLICLSHLRWDFVTQRPQHLLTRCAQSKSVFFCEEPLFDAHDEPWMEISARESGVKVVVPHLVPGKSAEHNEATQKDFLTKLLIQNAVTDYILWYYTPMALGFTRHLKPLATVYDCMDELSAFHGAPLSLREREAELLQRADVVFTGGRSLFDAKKHLHQNIHAFPSSIDAKHFAKARSKDRVCPADQKSIAGPRLGFYGVIDERMDLNLVREIAELRPQWQFIFLGPVVKIDPNSLPKLPNIHFLGSKSYEELPSYLAGWHVALLPFAQNDSTKFISPTKTPEYLAAGCPVVSTPIADVVRPYGNEGLVRVAATAAEFVAAAHDAMTIDAASLVWRTRVDCFLAQSSWDDTWQEMLELTESAVDHNSARLFFADRHAEIERRRQLTKRANEFAGERALSR